MIAIFNYADKPDLKMNELVPLVRSAFGYGQYFPVRLRDFIVYSLAKVFDCVTSVTGKSFRESKDRIQKLCSNSQLSIDRLQQAGFGPEHDLKKASAATIKAEFTL